MRHRICLRFAALGLAAVLPIACSGPDRAEWVQRADEICRRTDTAISKLPPPGNSMAAMVTYAGSVKKELEGQAQRLADLEPPEDDPASTDLDAYVRAQIDLIAQVEAAAQNANPESVEALFRQAAQELGSAGPKLKRDYGFTVCGSEAVSSPGDETPPPDTTAAP